MNRLIVYFFFYFCELGQPHNLAITHKACLHSPLLANDLEEKSQKFCTTWLYSEKFLRFYSNKSFFCLLKNIMFDYLLRLLYEWGRSYGCAIVVVVVAAAAMACCCPFIFQRSGIYTNTLLMSNICCDPQTKKKRTDAFACKSTPQ